MTDFDVVIIGGGPAGSTAGYYLSRGGLKVLILEKEKFPRPHVGESLVPFCYDIFNELGVLEEVEKTFVRKPGVKFVSGSGEFQTNYFFKNILDGPQHLSFHVIRAEFDDILLRNAERSGVEVIQRAKVIDFDLSVPDMANVEYEFNGDKIKVKCKFLIDATGQDTFLGKRLGFKGKIKDLDRVGFLCHWKGAKYTPEINLGLLHIIYLTDARRGWIAMQPVGLDRISIGLVLDNALSKESKAKAESTQDWKLSTYLNEIKNTPFLQPILENAELSQELIMVGNYSYSMSKKFDSNFAMIGDAASFLDPIFATGIFIAINNAKDVAESLIRSVNGSKEELLKDLDKTYSKHLDAIQLVERFIKLFYDQDKINFSEVGEESKEGKKNFRHYQVAFSLLHFLMGGDFYNNSKKYHEMLDFLESPKQIERYFHLRLKEGFHQSFAEYPFHQIFPMSQ